MAEKHTSEPWSNKCRRCSECDGAPHHALPNTSYGDDDAPEELRDVEVVCKHCDAVGSFCHACDGDGFTFDGDDEPCPACDGLGVHWQ